MYHRVCFEQDETYCDCALSSICCVFLVADRTVEFSHVTVLEDGMMKANREVEVPGSLLPQWASVALKHTQQNGHILDTLLFFSEAEQTPGRSQASKTIIHNTLPL